MDGSYFLRSHASHHHRHTGEILWIHREAAKFEDAQAYLSMTPPTRGWTHIAKAGAYTPWSVKFRQTVPNSDVFIPLESSQLGCHHPMGDDVVVREVEPAVCGDGYDDDDDDDDDDDAAAAAADFVLMLY